MKKIIALVLALVATGPLRADGVREGELSLPWTAFEKLLKADRDAVSLSWEEFQALVKQTGATETPSFTTQDGRVLLSRAEFKRLLDRMKPPAGEAAKAYLTKAVYAARMEGKSARVTARLRLQIPGGAEKIPPVRVPLFPGGVAFEDVLLDGRPALVDNKDGWTAVTVTRGGDHEVTAVFSAAASLDKPPHSLYFPVPETPITRLEFFMPLAEVDVNIPGASQVEKQRAAGGTLITAALPATSGIQATWNPVKPEEKKGPAKIYSTVHHMLSVEEDALRIKVRLELDVLQNTVNALNLRVPAGYTVLEVQGDAVGEWKAPAEGKDVLVIPLQYARQGRFNVDVTAEQVMKEKGSVIPYAGFQVLGAVRESGSLGVELKTTAEAKILEVEGLQRQDTAELPPALLNLTPKPLLYGFKYARPPFSLSLDVQRHEEVAVISTVVDQANGVTLVMADGKRVHHLTYTVRNTWKQFLELRFPPNAQVWTAFVEGQPVKPSRNADGKVLIPLNRSRAVNGDMSGFDVEVMYYEGDAGLPPAGLQGLEFPVPDVVVSQLFWSVYLPVDRKPLFFGGTVEKETGAAGFRPLMSAVSGKRDRVVSTLASVDYMQNVPKDKESRMALAKNSQQWRSRGSFSAAQSVDEDSYARQVEREVNFFDQVKKQELEAAGRAGAGPAGVLPIRVQVPNTGQVYRFTKRIVVEANPLTLDIVHAAGWLMGLLNLLFLALALWLLWKARRGLAATTAVCKAVAQRHQAEVRWALSPAGLPVAAGGLWFLSLFVSRFLAVIFFLVFLGALGRWAWERLALKRKGS